MESVASQTKPLSQNLKATYRRFLRAQEPGKKEEAGKDLIRAIFGADAIAEDPIL
jgi:hypothetical protein